MRVIRMATACVLSVAVVVLGAPIAAAHAELASSDPAANAILQTAPTTITLTFDDDVTLPNDAIKVTGPAGAAWTVGTPRADGKVVTAPVQADGPAGAYTVAWQVRSDDGDLINGTIPFTLTAAAGAAATPAAVPSAAAPAAGAPPSAETPPAAQNTAAQSGSSGLPAWVWVLIALVVVVIVVGAVTRARRRT